MKDINNQKKLQQTFVYHAFQKIDETGIYFKDGNFIRFEECVRGFEQVDGKKYKCIGEHDVIGLSYKFYTYPNEISITFIPTVHPIEANIDKHCFLFFQKAINDYGYTTILKV